MSPGPAPGATELPSQVQGCGPVWALSCTGGLGLKTALTPPVARTLNPGSCFVPGGPLLCFLCCCGHSVPAATKRGCSLHSLWSPRGRDGQGNTCSRQGQATPGVEGQAHRLDSSSPSSERMFLPGGEAGLAQTSSLTSRQRQLLRIWLPDPRPTCRCVKGGGPGVERHHTSSPASSCVASSSSLDTY